MPSSTRPIRTDDPGLGNRRLEHRCAVGRGEYRVRKVEADLAGVGVVGQHELDVGGPIAADEIVDQAGGAAGGIGIVIDPLHERARAIADADQPQPEF